MRGPVRTWPEHEWVSQTRAVCILGVRRARTLALSSAVQVALHQERHSHDAGCYTRRCEAASPCLSHKQVTGGARLALRVALLSGLMPKRRAAKQRCVRISAALVQFGAGASAHRAASAASLGAVALGEDQSAVLGALRGAPRWSATLAPAPRPFRTQPGKPFRHRSAPQEPLQNTACETSV